MYIHIHMYTLDVARYRHELGNIRTSTHACICTYVHVKRDAISGGTSCANACVDLLINIRIYVCMHIHLYVCIYIYIYIYIYILYSVLSGRVSKANACRYPDMNACVNGTSLSHTQYIHTYIQICSLRMQVVYASLSHTQYIHIYTQLKRSDSARS